MANNNNDNRFYLNINNNNERPGYNDRAYPTTPSTFPNPIFPSQGQQQSQQSQQQAPSNQNSQFATPFAPTGYFSNPQYPPSYPQQPPTTYQPGPHAVAQQPGYQPRVPPIQADATNGLVHQFSHQNLGGASRTGTYSNRPTGGAQRPRTAGAPGQQPAYSSYHNAPMPGHGSQQRSYAEFEVAPERNPNRYGHAVTVHQKGAINLAETFFKDNVKRARDRNVRQNDIEVRLADPNQSQSRREQTWSNAGKLEGKYLRFLRTKEKPGNYATLKIIGKGAFGEVKLVQRKTDGKIFAMKSLVKTEMYKKDQLAHVRAERDILAESDSPWVVKLHNTFQDYDFLYMLMEFLPGGDLMTMLIKYEIFSEDITRFYIAEIVLAIEAVHNYGFIHRDIKPDNILLDRGGHVKLTDFGLSTGFHKLHDNSYYQKLLSKNTTSSRARDRNSVSLDQINLTVSNRGVINDWRKSRRVMAYSTVGTPDYIAPEIFTGAGYGNDCDWWSLGTIMFECQVGWPPFCAEDAHDTYRKIVNWRQSLYFPEDVQLGPEAENLIRSLVCNTENRLGRGGASEIKNHKFFRGVEFDTLRRIRAPFEPKLSSNVDTTYFPTDEIDQTDNATILKAQNNGQPREELPELSLPFIGYTFKRFEQYNSR